MRTPTPKPGAPRALAPRPSGRQLGSLALSLSLILAACGQSTPTASQPAAGQPTASQPTTSQPSSKGSSFTLDPTHSFLDGQVVVGLEGGASAQQAADALGGSVLTELRELNVAVVRLPDGMSVQKAVRVLAGTDLARFAEPNYLMTAPERAAGALSDQQVAPTTVRPQATLNDPQLGKQWFLDNMGAYAAWNTATGKGIRIGIADEDMDRTHPDLKDNVVFPGFDSPNNKLITASTPYDGVGEHGTWVAGTAGAVGNNGIGGAGVAYQASLVPMTITHSSTGASNVDSARAFVWGVNGPDGISPGAAGDTDTPAGHKGYVDIINYSFGGTAYSQLSKEAIDYVLSRGVLFITSAGNTPTTGPASPAWTPGAISVAATNPRNGRTDFSNKGAHLTVGAPGQNMWVTEVRSDVTNASDVNYAYVDGTSFSSPATAGAAALVLQASAGKNADGSVATITLTPAQVRHILEDTAYKPSGAYSLEVGNGVVRADKAVALAATPNVASSVEKGVNVALKFVAQSDSTVGIPLVGVTLSGGKRPGQLLYAQSADGGNLYAAGVASFREIDAGSYQLYASGPRTVVAGGTPATLGTALTFAPGQSSGYTVPLPVSLPQDANEPNNTPATASPLSYGQVVNGVLPRGDVDDFRFTGVAGEVAFINSQTLTGSPNLKLTVLDSSGKVLATNSSQRAGVTDAALDFTVPTDGVYTVQVTDEGSTANPFNTYSLSLSRVTGSESEPNGSAKVTGDVFSALNTTGANAIAYGQALNAAIDPASDVDVYVFQGAAGDRVVADINTATSGKPDTVLSLFRADGTLVASNDDTNTPDSTVSTTLDSAGTYYLAVAAYTSSTQSSSGPYRLSLDKY